jgi:hypothetical protein
LKTWAIKNIIIFLLSLASSVVWAQNLLPTPISTAPYYFNAQPMMYPQMNQPYQLPNYWQQQQPSLLNYMPMISQFSDMVANDLSRERGGGSGNYDLDPDRNRQYRLADDYLYKGAKKRSSYRSSDDGTRSNPTPTPTPVATVAATVTPTPTPNATATPVTSTVTITDGNNNDDVVEIYEKVNTNDLTFKVDDKNEDIDIELDATLHNVVALLKDPSEIGRGVPLICLAQNNEEIIATPASLGARRVMATMYQSCESLGRIIDGTQPVRNNITKDVNGRRTLSSNGVETYLEQNIFSKGRTKPPPEGCFDLATKPPMYGYGAKGSRNNQSGTVNVVRNQAGNGLCGNNGVACTSSPVQAIDCSGFVAAALATQGLRMTQGEDTHPAWFGTSHFAGASKKAKSCFADVPIASGLSLMPGDIISYSANHVIMIDEVGPDPLGVQKYSQPGKNCNDIHYRDFDFTYLHSGSIGNYGPARVSSKYHERVPGTIFKTLRVKAIEACRSIQAGVKAVTVTQGKFSVIRHRGKAVDGCTGPQKPLEGEQCVQSCFPSRS